jgi:XRE family aerobic/anaerobic benzoate catabolism transcriptional regulator
MNRVLDQGDLRPMADGPQAMDDLKAILESRTPLYAKANAIVSTSGKSEGEALKALLARIPIGASLLSSAQVAHARSGR